MLGSPPPFRVEASTDQMLGRRSRRRPHTASGAGAPPPSIFQLGTGNASSSGGGGGGGSGGCSSGNGMTSVRPLTTSMGSLSSQQQQPPVARQSSHLPHGTRPVSTYLASRVSISSHPPLPLSALQPQPPPPRPQIMKPSHPHFVSRNGRKHLDLTPKDLPYPNCYDRDFLDMQILDHLELVKLKGGVGSIIDFNGKFPHNVLDLGCGTGAWVLDAAKQWPDASFVGFDIAPVQFNVELAQPNLASRIQWVRGNFLTERLPFADCQFDHVNIRFIARGVPEDKWHDLFEEVSRVLSPGGSLSMTEADIIFPTLPRSFTARIRQRRKTRTGELTDLPKHDHALLEHLFFSVFERRFVNTQPTSILMGILNIHFKSGYGGPRIDMPYPPPPVPQDDPSHSPLSSSLSGSTQTSGPSSPSTLQPLPLPSPIPISGPSRVAHQQFASSDTSDCQLSETETISPRSTSPTRPVSSSGRSSNTVTSFGKPYQPFEATESRRLGNLREEVAQKIILPVADFGKYTPRALALHLHNSYTEVLAMRESMWEELRLQLRDPAKRAELAEVGWEFDFTGAKSTSSLSVSAAAAAAAAAEPAAGTGTGQDLGEARARFERLVGSYAADMHARTSVRDALAEGLGWTAPAKAPPTKAEIALELDRERERTVARRQERESGFSEDMLICRGIRGFCGFKEGGAGGNNGSGPTSPS
ncbi:hypothetical protein BKA62DRAFT_765718 [Auriculariales sp. MPI-PUGE-AT-0066]|nr:hypothetical protein BKA62DRAFT_765718 [Auriculariales sp. MPI-PUGE-AT-0066]